jgi:hypothetical protein
MSRNIFLDEWRNCLCEHFIYVVRVQDSSTEPTLRGVLRETGFSEAEIEALYQEGLRQQATPVEVF